MRRRVSAGPPVCRAEPALPCSVSGCPCAPQQSILRAGLPVAHADVPDLIISPALPLARRPSRRLPALQALQFVDRVAGAVLAIIDRSHDIVRCSSRGRAHPPVAANSNTRKQGWPGQAEKHRGSRLAAARSRGVGQGGHPGSLHSSLIVSTAIPQCYYSVKRDPFTAPHCWLAWAGGMALAGTAARSLRVLWSACSTRLSPSPCCARRASARVAARTSHRPIARRPRHAHMRFALYQPARQQRANV